MAREQLQNLTEPMYYILLALLEERHGYEVMQVIGDITENRVTVGPGTLYALLARFEGEGIINQVSVQGRRKNYKITDKGKEILDEEIKRLRTLINDGEKVKGNEIIGPAEAGEEGKGIAKNDKKTTKERRIFRRGRDDDILW
ncbi:MAG: PadR family transcriptional regulator [Tissierellaceae bacterium]|nr:PadR family transcriptional regulator [Tissierellaceae bacterium]